MDFKDLSPELREKAGACKAPDELLALAKSEGYSFPRKSSRAFLAADGRAPISTQ